MNRRVLPQLRNILLLLGLWLSSLATAQAAYNPPVGIPAPPFGIDERLEDYYQRPTPWDQETPGWYYIDQHHPNASNKNTYGTPAAPRATIPQPIPAGSVVEIHGLYNYASIGYEIVEARGTPDAPVFIIGGSGTTSGPAVVTRKWAVKSTYTIIENIEFTDRGKINFALPTHHVALRNSELHHIAGKIGGGGRSDSERLHHIVIYNNKIHSEDGWNLNPDRDLDNHAIKFGPYTEDVWILENVGYNNGGNFIQIGDWGDGTLASMNRARRFYVGRNTISANRQNPIGVKQAINIIISENHLYDNQKVQSNIAGQSAISFQYGPENVWILNNRIHDSNAAISGGSDSGGGGKNIYIIGNLIYDIAPPPGYKFNKNTGWALAAMTLAGGTNRYIINNTMINITAGINTPAPGPLFIANNIIANTTEGYHIFMEPRASADSSEIFNNIIFQENGNIEIRSANEVVNTIGLLEVNHVAGGNMERDPQLDTTTWMPTASSPAVDQGTTAGFVDGVFKRFQELYGIDIRQDIYGTPRPQGNAWDIGAVESGSSAAISVPAAPRNVRATVIQ